MKTIEQARWEILAEAIGRYRFTFNNEHQLKEQLAELFTREGIVFEREHRLSAQDIPDFWLPSFGWAIEVKIQGSIVANARQCARYARYPEVQAVGLIQPRVNALMNAPTQLYGKPFFLIGIWKGLF